MGWRAGGWTVCALLAGLLAIAIASASASASAAASGGSGAPRGPGSSAWRAPIALTGHGVVNNGWIDSAGVFRSVGEVGGRPRLTTVHPPGSPVHPPGSPVHAPGSPVHAPGSPVHAPGSVSGAGISDGDRAAVAVGGGRTLAVSGQSPVRLAVLDRRGRRLRTLDVPGRPPFLLGFDVPSAVGLSGGGAVVCTDLARGGGEELAVVAPGGRSLRTIRLRPVPGAAAAASPTGGCFGVAAAARSGRAAIIVENADGAAGSGATSAQVLVVRVARHGPPSAPQPVVPAGEMFTVNQGEPEVTETSAGWVAVTWLSTRAAGERLITHQNLRWVSPSGRIGPVVALTAPRSSIPPAITLAATGPRSAVALINPEARNRVIDSVPLRASGHVGPRRTLFTGHGIVPPRIAGDERRLIATWQAGGAIYAATARTGRWSAPVALRRCRGVGVGAVCPFDPGAAVGPTGRGAVWFSLVGPHALRTGGAVSFAGPR